MRVLFIAAVVLTTSAALTAQTSTSDAGTNSALLSRSVPSAAMADGSAPELPPFPVLPGMVRSTERPVKVAPNYNTMLHRSNPTTERSGLPAPGMHRSIGGGPVAGQPQQPVPEPETVILFSMGMAGLAFMMWKRGLFANLRFARQHS